MLICSASFLLFVRSGDAECGKLNKVYSPQGNLRVFLHTNFMVISVCICYNGIAQSFSRRSEGELLGEAKTIYAFYASGMSPEEIASRLKKDVEEVKAAIQNYSLKGV